MENWKELFINSFNKFNKNRELDMQFIFEKPASDKELSEIEHLLHLSLPGDLQDMLKQFNGIKVKDRFWGWKNLYLSTFEIATDIQEYIHSSGNDFPPEKQMKNICFFSQQNGYAVLHAICCKPFKNFTVGQIVKLDVEFCEFALEHPTLKEFILDPTHCSLD